jgi:SAM-dependent methyltransferase
MTEPNRLSLPAWASSVLACPQCRASLVAIEDLLSCQHCGLTAKYEAGIVRFDAGTSDAAIAWYNAAGGTQLHDRAQIPFTTSSLDSPVYRSYLEAFRPNNLNSTIVDVGAGDGRNTEPWLLWGYQRVIAVDAISASLARLRDRVANEHPECFSRLLLVQCDIRRLPLASACANRVLAIEALCYLNDDFAKGLVEASRLLNPAGRIMISERAWEGALVSSLLYRGLGPMLDMRQTGDIYDATGENLVRTKTFTEAALISLIQGIGLEVLERKGISILPLLLGYVRQQGRLSPADEPRLPETCDFMMQLGLQGQMRRTHVIVAGPRTGV